MALPAYNLDGALGVVQTTAPRGDLAGNPLKAKVRFQ
jgi:hypothetical protein